MFRDNAQQHHALRLLTQLSPDHGQVWSDAGPLPHAADVVRVIGKPESLLLRAAWTIAGAPLEVPAPRLDELLDSPFPEQRDALLRLVTARDQGPAAIDQWCRIYRYALRGERLCAMRKADYRRWLEHVAAVFEEAYSLGEAADMLGVSLATAKRWHTEPDVRKAINPRAAARPATEEG